MICQNYVVEVRLLNQLFQSLDLLERDLTQTKLD